MKCEKHPDTDAVGACVSCGRGVCPICKLTYNNMIHCKDCIESGRIGGHGYFGQSQTGTYGAAASGYGTSAYPSNYYSYSPSYNPYYPYSPYYYPYQYGTPTPTQMKADPRGIPDKRFYSIGLIGCVGGGISAIIAGLSVWMAVVDHNLFFSNGMILSAGVFTLFMFFYALGLYGFYRNVGSMWGLIGAISVVACTLVVLPATYMAVVDGTTHRWDGDYFDPEFMWVYVSHLFLGIGIMLSAAALQQTKAYYDPIRQSHGLLGWAAIGLLVSSILFICIIGIYLVGWVILGISLFLLSVEFHYAPLPSNEELEKKAKDEFFLQPWEKEKEGRPSDQSPAARTAPRHGTAAEPVYPAEPVKDTTHSWDHGAR